jgi:hypothetical protein
MTPPPFVSSEVEKSGCAGAPQLLDYARSERDSELEFEND